MEWSEEQVEALRILGWRLDTVEELAGRGVIDPAVAEAQRAYYLGEAASVAGQPFSAEQLLSARSLAEQGIFSGYFSLLDAVWFGVGGLLLVATVWLAGLYLFPLIRRAPRWVHELILFCIGGALSFGPALGLEGGGAVAVAAVGCLWLLGAALFVAGRRPRWWRAEGLVRGMGAIFWPVWGGVALLYESALLGGLSAAAFLALAGAVILPFWEEVHFVRREWVPLGMSAAALLLAGCAGLSAGVGVAPEAARFLIFQPGAAVLGSAVWLGGCLTLASDAYRRRYHLSWLRWGGAQLLVGVSAAAAMIIGSIYGVELVREVNGTFVAFYVLEKFFALPWRRHGYAWMCLGLALLLYGGARFAEQHPGYFLGF